MSDIDLAQLRRVAVWTAVPTLASRLMRAAADRIEALEAERDAAEQQVALRQKDSIARRIAMATVAEVGTETAAGDAADSLAELLIEAEQRAEHAEARLARVTDDSMAESIDAVLFNPDESRRHEDDDNEAGAVLAVIRAVAADVRCLARIEPSAPGGPLCVLPVGHGGSHRAVAADEQGADR